MKKTIKNFLPLLVLIVFALSACGSAQPAATLAGTSWKLVSYGPVASQIAAVADKDANLDFDTQGMMSGNVGCNGFSGDYKATDGQLTPGQIESTMMACDDPLMQQESAVLTTLNGTLKYEIEKDTLRIYSSDGQTLLTFVRK
jgi:heat shock protein HslJ